MTLPRHRKAVQTGSCGCAVQHGMQQNDWLMNGYKQKLTVACRPVRMPGSLSESARAMAPYLMTAQQASPLQQS